MWPNEHKNRNVEATGLSDGEYHKQIAVHAYVRVTDQCF